MLTLSIIKADTGGYVGHTAMHPAMIDTATRELDRVRGELLIDGQVAYCGDDLALVMTHERGIEAEAFAHLFNTAGLVIDPNMHREEEKWTRRSHDE